MKRQPTGFIAKCQCGSIVDAMDFSHTDPKDAGRILGEWLARGRAVLPQFGSEWYAHIMPCTCDPGITSSTTEHDLPAGGHQAPER